MFCFFADDPDDPNVDPDILLFVHAQRGSITGMQEALDRGASLNKSAGLTKTTAMHLAASFPGSAGTEAVRWLLEKGHPWCIKDGLGFYPEDAAMQHGNMETFAVLREEAIATEYERCYKPDEDGTGRFSFKVLKTISDADNIQYCNAPVQYLRPLRAPDEEVAMICPGGTGVMMEWERPIMRETARLLLEGMPKKGLRILNIGFGIGMIDTYFQAAHPEEHVIIEAHPQCLGWMKDHGWHNKPGVYVLEGRWQDILVSDPSPDTKPPRALRSMSLNGIGKFDVVYFDTFEEGYTGHFNFIKRVPGLLRGPGSRFSYFNGHGRSIKKAYEIYAEVARRHHNDLGMNTEWHEVQVDERSAWFNVQKYGQGLADRWPYTIPICSLAPTIPRTLVAGVGWNVKSSADAKGRELV